MLVDIIPSLSLPSRSLTDIVGVQKTIRVHAERTEGWVGESLRDMR
jgi:hypothetical protein